MTSEERAEYVGRLFVWTPGYGPREPMLCLVVDAWHRPGGVAAVEAIFATGHRSVVLAKGLAPAAAGATLPPKAELAARRHVKALRASITTARERLELLNARQRRPRASKGAKASR